MSQLLLINSSLARISAAVNSNSKQLEAILNIDRRVRALAMPVPKFPSSFMKLLPIKSLNDLQIAESLLSSTDNTDDFITYREELVSVLRIFFI